MGSSGDFFVMKAGSTPMAVPTGSNIQHSVPTNPLLKNAAGTAQYNDATLRCTQNASPPPLTEALYNVSCRVQDGAGGDITVQTDFDVLMV